MKRIKNQSVTGRHVYLSTPDGPKAIWLAPRAEVVVPESFLTTTAKNLAQRRILKISNA